MSITVLGLSSTSHSSHLWSTCSDDFSPRVPGPLVTWASLTPTVRTTDPLDGIDPSFTFDFRTYDEIGDGQRWTTWFDVEPLCRGPEPRPSWVVETRGAIDTELGILKTGKEADVFLLERGRPATTPTAGW